MRHHRRVKAAPDRHPTLTVPKRVGRLLAPFLAVSLTATAMVTNTGVARAQNLADGSLADETTIVDVSDPSITIDLSVLNDDGLAPQNLTFKDAARLSSAPAQKAKGSKAPGARMPVSTLYIQPSQKFRLPAQTKPLQVKPLVKPRPATRMATDIPVPAAPVKPVSKPVISKPVAATTPPPPPTMTPAPMPPSIKAPAAPAVVVTKVEAPAPAPVPTPTAQPPAPPPPMALPQAPAHAAPAHAAPAHAAPAHDPQTAQNLPPVPAPAPTPAPIDETQTAPAPTGSALVVDLPPQDSAGHPGIASLPPTTGALGDGDNMRIVFAQNSSKLPSGARAALKSMSERMRTQDNLRLQLLAYAGDTDTSASAARRLSLSRALAVRSFLIESGVRSTRIDVRALGNKSTDTVTERVDITVVER